MTEIAIELGPLDSTDAGLLRTWRNDYRIWRWTRQNDLISDAAQVRWFNRQSEDPTIKMWKVQVISKDGEKLKATPVGVCGLTSIDFQHSRAEFSLYIAPALHGRGLGRRALCVLLEHGFTNLGLNLIWGETFDGNPAAQMFEKVGMVKEGTRRGFYWKDGKRTDAHLYSITREEWRGRPVGAVDSLGPDHSGGLKHVSGGPSGLSPEAGQGPTSCQRPPSGASPTTTVEAAKLLLDREKEGTAKAGGSRRRGRVAS